MLWDNMITKKIRRLPKPDSVQVGTASTRPTLNVIDSDGNAHCLHISTAVAEFLIANGMSYEG